jgi:ABC-type sugar transport system ATPase subunit
MTLTVSDITFGYTKEQYVLRNISLEIETGEIVALLGPSGCGKSTLLHCIVGLLTPDSGSIAVDGEIVNKMKPSDRGIGIMMQDQPLYEHMTVEQNIAFPLRAQGHTEHIHDVLDRLELTAVAKQKVSRCSGGERRRVAFGRAIAKKPSVLLLDEPFTSVQGELQKIIQDVVSSFGAATLLVTHNHQTADIGKVIEMEHL